MATYYRKIKGKTYDKALLDAAEKSVQGRGDGRISLSDAKKILGKVKDSTGYTDIEKRTLQYIRDKFDFTPESDRWFRTEIRKWAAKKSSGAAAAKKTSKKSAKKTAKKAAKKSSPPQKTAAKKSAAAVFRDEPYAESEISAPVRPREPKKPSGKMSLIMRLLLLILIIAILFIIAMIVSPNFRDQIKGKFCPSEISIKQDEPLQVQEQKTVESKPREDVVTDEIKPAAPVEDEGDFYVVQVKDDLVSISEKQLGDSKRWIDIYNANRDRIQYPTLIFPGQKLKMPPAKNENN